MKTFLLFASYGFGEDKIERQGCVNSTLTLETPSEFPYQMLELEKILKNRHNAKTIVINNITLTEWVEC